MELKVPKIWIADDDEAIRIVLEEGLKSAGLEIATFADGESLIDALNIDKPDLIISDIKMPGMHGYDLLKHIKNNYEKLPVIIMTAFTDMQAAIDAYGGGAFEYIPKPFDLEEAISTVKKALEEQNEAKPKKVSKSEIIDHARMNKPGQGFYKVLAESALRAVKLCQPLRVPTTGYERWKELQLNFDAREMLEG